VARHVVHNITDDLDGSPDAVEVEFSLDGQRWTIDLGPRNEANLRSLLQPYIDAARKVTAKNGRGGRGRGAPARATARERNRAVREWALANGVELPARGRIAQAYLDAYDAGDVARLYEAAGLEMPQPDKPKRRRKADS
jgi:Lsr2.